jgi:hypothetical protein
MRNTWADIFNYLHFIFMNYLLNDEKSENGNEGKKTKSKTSDS